MSLYQRLANDLRQLQTIKEVRERLDEIAGEMWADMFLFMLLSKRLDSKPIMSNNNRSSGPSA